MAEISVIIPVYNGAATLKRTVDSVLNQTFGDYEIIIADDASEDESFTIAKSYAEKDGRIKVIKNEKNSFVGYTREKALEKAEGKYIFFLDSDDEMFSSDVFENAMRSAYEKEKDGADIIVSSTRLTDKGKKLTAKIKSAADIFIFSPFLSQSFYKKSVISFPFSFERKTAEDCEWLYKNLPNAKSIAATAEPFYVYTEKREGSLTTNMKREYISPTADTFIKMYEGENAFPEKDKKKIKRYCANALIEHAIRAKNAGDSDTVKKCVPFLKKSKAAPFIALSKLTGINAALGIINLKMKIR